MPESIGKAISIRQPWPWLMIRPDVVDPDERLALQARQHIKDIENRGWESNHRGPLLIHASLRFHREGYDWVRARFPEIPMPEPRGFELGGVIGRVTVPGCVRSSDSPWFFGPVGVVLLDPQPLPFIPGRGWLGVFDFKPEDPYA